jgi:hypothetical protein
MTDKPKVVICVPSIGTWTVSTAVAHGNLRAYSTACGIYTTPLAIQCSQISLSRNIHVREALKTADGRGEPTHILWHDSDLVFPPDTLTRLLAHDKDIVGAFYNRRSPPYETVGRFAEPEKIDFATAKGLVEAEYLPGGLRLVKMDVYRKIAQPWYWESFDLSCASQSDPLGTVSEDVNFCRKVRENGYNIWCDLDLTFQMGHMGEQMIPCLRPVAINLMSQPA